MHRVCGIASVGMVPVRVGRRTACAQLLRRGGHAALPWAPIGRRRGGATHGGGGGGGVADEVHASDANVCEHRHGVVCQRRWVVAAPAPAAVVVAVEVAAVLVCVCAQACARTHTSVRMCGRYV